jgi:alkylhydroperoxidase family enzyme
MVSKHLKRYGYWLTGALVSVWASPLLAADEPSTVPKPIPATRPEMKAALEALKARQPRVPLPAPAEGEASSNYLPATWGGGGGLGGPGQTNNRGARDSRGNFPDPRMDSLFTDPCFWVVSRGNNCHYCLGHQELKLRAGGLDDDAIAALDSNWSRFDPRQQAALAFARKLTLEPALVGDADVTKLQQIFSDVEIIELAFSIARFNSVNRWTDGMGLPQERYVSEEGESALTTPTREQFARAKSIVTPDTRTPRGPLPTPENVAAAIEACRSRTPRVELPSEADAKHALADSIGDRNPLVWERALSGLPEVGKAHVVVWNTIMTDEHLSPRLKAELAYISAVNNRAWYAAGTAARRLVELGASPEGLVSLCWGEASGPPGADAAYRLARKLTADPHLITDQDIAAVREHYSDPETAQIVQVICMANLFDRFTESLGLPLE